VSERLPAKLEVSALIRQVGAQGGFGTVIARGEAEAGTIMVVLCANGSPARAFERMPRADGTRGWACAKTENRDDPGDFAAWLERRQLQDPDMWIVELDIVNGERFIGLSPDS